MDKNNRSSSWKERNKAIKTFQTSGRFGWMHLVIAENRTTNRRFLRLKKYMNWFGIPDVGYFYAVQDMLKRGAKELGWPLERPLSFSSDKKKDVQSEIAKIPKEIISFIKNNPTFTKELIALNIQSLDKTYIFELTKTIDTAIKQTGNRFKTAFKEVLEKISKQDALGMQNLSDLMDKWNLYQITSITNILKSRLDIIETFEQMIIDEKTYEINTDNSIHRVLEKNMWLIDENYWIIQANKTLRTFIGDEIIKQDQKHSKKRPDFACVNTHNKLIIIEIKRPSIELKKAEVDQAELYLRIAKKYKSERYGSIEVFLFGNKISEDAREMIEIRKNMYIKTYNDLLEETKKRYYEYLKVLNS